MAAQGALPLVGTARGVVSRPKQKRSYKEQADTEGYRLPLVGEQEWKPAEDNGIKNID